MDWPNDADGDVLRRLQDQGFDFTQPCTIDFSIDFLEWPPPREAIDLILACYPKAVVYPEEGDSAGYVLFEVHDKLTYELVIRVQAQMTAMLAQFGGVCESWGVLH